MVNLTRDADGRARARLLDLVPGRSGQAYTTWLRGRGEDFRSRVGIATLDPFQGYKNAIDDQLEDAIAVPDAFHVVRLATQVVDDVRRRVQQETTGHRGRKGDPLYRVRNVLRAGEENLTDRQRARLEAAFTARAEHVEVEVAYRCAQQVRSAYHQASHAAGRVVSESVLAALPSCPIPVGGRLFADHVRSFERVWQASRPEGRLTVRIEVTAAATAPSRTKTMEATSATTGPGHPPLHGFAKSGYELA